MGGTASLNVVWRRAVVLAVAISCLIIGAMWLYPTPISDRLKETIHFKDKPDLPPLPSPTTEIPAQNLENLTVADLLRELWRPLMTPIHTKKFTTIDGVTYKSAGAPIWDKPLGKRLLILDVDSRPLDEEGEINSDKPFNWTIVQPKTSAMLDHYLYSIVHGYDYKFVRAPNYEDRWGTWVKVPVTKEMLKSYDVVITLDADVGIMHLGLPMEWLMNHWRVTKKHMVAMAEDPAGDPNLDWNGKALLNTGFVISIASERTQSLYEEWAKCPSEEDERYDTCAEWKGKRFHEQSAFGNLIRYQHEGANDIRKLPCKEANGNPEHGFCTGDLVRHYWANKEETKPHFARDVMDAMLTHLTNPFKEHILDLSDKRFDGADILRR